MPVYDNQVVDPDKVVPNEGAPVGEVPESIKLWRRDWDAMPDAAQIRYRALDNTLGVAVGRKEGDTAEQGILGPWPTGSELLGWYWLANPHSDAAYGDPGEGTG